MVSAPMEWSDLRVFLAIVREGSLVGAGHRTHSGCDLLGRRRMFLVGLALFATASLAGGLAQSEGWLIAARAATPSHGKT